MVSKKVQRLFLEAVEDLGTQSDGFSSLDDLLESFDLPYGKALLEDRFIRAAVWNLSKESPWSDDYKGFLLQVKPGASARYLVGALANPVQRVAALEVLFKYGPSRVTVGPLVGALASPEHVDVASDVLISFGQAALRFIRQPFPGSKLYEPLTTVIRMINAKAA